MHKPKLLTVLIGITLVVALLNLYATLNLYLRLSKIARKLSERSTAPTRFPPPAAKPPVGPRIEVSTENDEVKGSRKAPVTIIEFSDYQCPFSGNFYSQTLPQIEKNYIKSGKVKFAYRDFPLGFHQYAQKAAEAAECAGEQGKYWAYHDTLFENQKSLDLASLKKYAQDLGLDMRKFNNCLDSGKMAAEVKQDMVDGGKYGVSGTPCFFINGLKLEGAKPYNVFEEIIEKEVKK